MSTTAHAPQTPAPVVILDASSQASAQTSSGEVTVVVIDSSAPQDLMRCLHQILAAKHRDVEVVVASLRKAPLSGPAARRVRLVRAAGPAQLDAAIARELTRPRMVVAASAQARFTPGWLEDLREQAEAHPRVVSTSNGAGGGMLLYPPAVTTDDAPRIAWDTSVRVSTRAGKTTARTRRTLSVMVVTRDCASTLPAFITALEPFANQVVVVDAGSTDGTVDIARAMPRVVLVEDTDPADAATIRNRALALATGDWVLELDPAETLSGSPDDLHRLLANESVDHLRLRTVTGTGDGAPAERYPVRAFRRETSTWRGTSMPYPAPLTGRSIGSSATAPATLTVLRDDEGPWSAQDRRSADISDLGQVLLGENHLEEGLAVLEELRILGGEPTAVVTAGRAALPQLIGLGRHAVADLWIEAMSLHGEARGNLAVHRARVLTASGKTTAAKDLLAPWEAGDDGGLDPQGLPMDDEALERALAHADHVLGATGEAADRMARLALRLPATAHVTETISLLWEAGRSLRDFAAIAPHEFLERSLRTVAATTPVDALIWLEAFRQAHPQDHRPVVAGNVMAARSGWRTALTWSAHARELGLAEVCALRQLTKDPNTATLDRAIAYAILAGAFGEGDATAATHLVAALTPQEDATLRTTLTGLGLPPLATSS